MASAAAQRLIARTLLSLPAPLLRLMAGGGVVMEGVSDAASVQG